jgi:hypothetical protein
MRANAQAAGSAARARVSAPGSGPAPNIGPVLNGPGGAHCRFAQERIDAAWDHEASWDAPPRCFDINASSKRLGQQVGAVIALPQGNGLPAIGFSSSPGLVRLDLDEVVTASSAALPEGPCCGAPEVGVAT